VGEIIRKAHEYGLPAVLWTYPRGPGVNDVGGDSLYWVHYGVVVAESLGADIIKTKFPEPVKKEKKEIYDNYIKKISKKIKSVQRYIELEPDEGEELTEKQHKTRMKLVVDAVPRSFVVVSGGPKIKEKPEENLAKITRIVMNAGAEGRIIGRNFWGVPINKGMKYTNIVAEIMKQPKYYRSI
jgi:DhnA family fructose-bisphosphate aldolase class Ia